MKRALVIGALAVSAWVGACTKVSSDPNAVVAISFDALPFPAVVVGDTLRDEAGVPIALNAVALNPDGDVIPGAEIAFISLDPAGVVSPDGFIIANVGTATQMRVVAQAGALQSRALTVVITPRPDSIAQQGTVDTIRYRVVDESSFISQAITLKIFNNEVTPPVPARGWIVNFALEYHGVPEANATSTRAFLIDESNRRSDKDTADAQGQVSRRLRIALPDSAGLDSISVIATATHRGLSITGSPVRITVRWVDQ